MLTVGLTSSSRDQRRLQYFPTHPIKKIKIKFSQLIFLAVCTFALPSSLQFLESFRTKRCIKMKSFKIIILISVFAAIQSADCKCISYLDYDPFKSCPMYNKKNCVNDNIITTCERISFLPR